eukprot:gnl/TRDRNA2_/TRDRNA2_158264_c1_seq1.p1 gnl/TRDRNA2_/TRDRNA2_158264_c1~~gnl/TRDRNA2_/TRDRNA2_158264_c1_seq1.p1  ORF type:complete len:1385 (-),score=263.03 gnl/TRDRNA2_/TRDRNA2_158264_c1_seq1:30-3692(-)
MRQPAPSAGLKATRLFEENEVWATLLRVAERRTVLSAESVAWTVADKEVEDYPLVYISQQFEAITGYEIASMLGRNCRFLQPSDCGRNDAFNGDEKRRMHQFCRASSGTMASLVLNQKADGAFFWNLVMMEHRMVDGHGYILAANKHLTVHQELLSMMNTWDHRSLGYITSLRLLLKAREPHLSPSPSRLLVNEPLFAEMFAEWSESIKQDLSDFWEGDHFVPPVGGRAVKAFEGTWTPLMEVAEESMKKIHGIREATLQNTRNNTEGGITCAVADPSAPDCPLVFVSREFERMTGYKWEFALGRNCRFLQPNNRQFNIKLNGDEVAQMRHFCSEPRDHPIGSAIIVLLLNEKKGGERFWNLLHMTHVDVAGRRYILGVQTVLDLPMPGFLARADDLRDEAVSDLCLFLAKLRGRLQCMIKEPSGNNITELSASVLAEILDYLKSATDDYEGDHYVPKKGVAESKQFETDRKWAAVWDEVAPDMKRIFEATEETYRKTAADERGCACCTVADPLAEDCALLYISKGFEELTGYHRDWALGRNCRFLQPNAKSYNDAYNLWERSQMREFCELPKDGGPPKRGRLLSLLVNEARDGYPFWNALVMQHIVVKSAEGARPYIFGVQTNFTTHLGVLGELLAGGPDGFAQLGRLRAILRQREVRLGSYSLATLMEESLTQWMSILPTYMQPPRSQLPLASNINLPTFGIELARNEQGSLEDKMLSALDEGIRHFHLNFAMKLATQTTDLEGRLFALRLVEALAVIKQRHLHYLRDSLVFSLRAKPSQLAGCTEILSFLNTAGLRVSLWLLDASDASPNQVADVWPELDRAVHNNFVEVVGLYGGGPAEFAAAGGNGLVRPAVQALDLYVGVQLACRSWVHVNKLSQSGVAVMTCKPFGPRCSLLSSPLVKSIAKERCMDPAMLLLKWAEGLGYMCVAPVLRSRSCPAAKSIRDDIPFVLNGTRRAFVREYSNAQSAANIVQVIKRRFPNTTLDQVRQQPASAPGDTDAKLGVSITARSTGRGPRTSAVAKGPVSAQRTAGYGPPGNQRVAPSHSRAVQAGIVTQPSLHSQGMMRPVSPSTPSPTKSASPVKSRISSQRQSSPKTLPQRSSYEGVASAPRHSLPLMKVAEAHQGNSSMTASTAATSIPPSPASTSCRISPPASPCELHQDIARREAELARRELSISAAENAVRGVSPSKPVGRGKSCPKTRPGPEMSPPKGRPFCR